MSKEGIKTPDDALSLFSPFLEEIEKRSLEIDLVERESVGRHLDLRRDISNTFRRLREGLAQREHQILQELEVWQTQKQHTAKGAQSGMTALKEDIVSFRNSAAFDREHKIIQTGLGQKKKIRKLKQWEMKIQVTSRRFKEKCDRTFKEVEEHTRNLHDRPEFVKLPIEKILEILKGFGQVRQRGISPLTIRVKVVVSEEDPSSSSFPPNLGSRKLLFSLRDRNNIALTNIGVEELTRDFKVTVRHGTQRNIIGTGELHRCQDTKDETTQGSYGENLAKLCRFAFCNQANHSGEIQMDFTLPKIKMEWNTDAGDGEDTNDGKTEHQKSKHEDHIDGELRSPSIFDEWNLEIAFRGTTLMGSSMCISPCPLSRKVDPPFGLALF